MHDQSMMHATASDRRDSYPGVVAGHAVGEGQVVADEVEAVMNREIGFRHRESNY